MWVSDGKLPGTFLDISVIGNLLARFTLRKFVLLRSIIAGILFILTPSLALWIFTIFFKRRISKKCIFREKSKYKKMFLMLGRKKRESGRIQLAYVRGNRQLLFDEKDNRVDTNDTCSVGSYFHVLQVIKNNIGGGEDLHCQLVVGLDT